MEISKDIHNKENSDKDEFIKLVLEEYFPKNFQQNVQSGDIIALSFLKKLEYDCMRCFSLNNENVHQGWKNFLDNLPDSQNEIVPRIEERFWRWKIYKKYEPHERTNFRKTMKCGPNIDQFGRLPITGEDMRFYRSSFKR
ncbi:hypothetical protein TSAR_014190 [Trichomalopsis sarcophagae]|uniref:Uncharacterized protein n=1 Tax=Trichomalopsis sarcophagae TaxID=543379 RepID=A0A232FK99_9HYME|nr:hypothetical protein TSAR_014190 [Trichomalopsis sarcophagae]